MLTLWEAPSLGGTSPDVRHPGKMTRRVSDEVVISAGRFVTVKSGQPGPPCCMAWRFDDGGVVGGDIRAGRLAKLAETLADIPRVHLRDTEPVTGPEPVVRLVAEMPDPSDRLARLQLLGEVARGGMGVILKGRDNDLGRDLAVKVLLEQHRETRT